eukprot:TRINITY_DN24199_c0_g2_i3.p1 TRINITY_DN24199_c0_g2~~TRINITY_DN24199_c0_g2_i3.p1  ORF type:complete len:271 (-),score=72.48 TRINITY_DN24199_c0_g2_i3:152-964(-)
MPAMPERVVYVKDEANPENAPRPDALCWDDYFMSVAFLTAMRSKDPSTQVGAVIVNDLNRIIGVGYNGFPSNAPKAAFPWAKASEDGQLATKYPYVCHAELNAVLNKNAESCRGCKLYCTLFPCNECAKVIIQSGIKQVIFASEKNKSQAGCQASRELFRLCGVEMRQHAPELSRLHIALRYPEDEPNPEPKAKAEFSKNANPVVCSACFASIEAPAKISAAPPAPASAPSSLNLAFARASGVAAALSVVALGASVLLRGQATARSVSVR